MTKQRIFISGLINIETTLQIDAFPIAYTPVRYPFFGAQSTVSGVGYNIAKALLTLGDEPRFGSLIGRDLAGDMVLRSLEADGIPSGYILQSVGQTAQSVILYDKAGQRQINVDLKDIQEQRYPLDSFAAAIDGCQLAVLCNINFSRPLLAEARRRGIPIACDVHTIADLDDPYNRDFMAEADILFMSHEQLPAPPETWLRQLMQRYRAEVVVIGMGGAGALLELRGAPDIQRLPAVVTRPIANTIGAGDALFSAFLHYFLTGIGPLAALQRAITFASYKIGVSGAASGFLSAAELEILHSSVNSGAPTPSAPSAW